MSIQTNIQNLRTHIPENVKLVCVSKFHPESAVLEAYESGERIFGESRVQEFTKKQEDLPKDIQWHFIGHLQTNKVKQVVPIVDLIHGVDSVKLLNEINKEAGKAGKVVNCLFQIHIAEEDTKFGFDEQELTEFLSDEGISQYPNVRICGLMGMATFTDDKEQIRREFRFLKNFFHRIKNTYFKDSDAFSELSMGMSDDFGIAIEEGSTMVRIGTTIFGKR